MSSKNKARREVDSPLYNYWQAFFLSFFSPRLYVDVGKRWRGFGALYLLLLMTIVTLPFALRVTTDFNHFFKTQIIDTFKQIPKLYVQNGKVSFDKPMPYFIKNDKGQVVGIIDTTGSIATIDNRYPFLSTLITSDKVIYRLPNISFFFMNAADSSNPIYIQPLGVGMNEVFEGEQLVTSFGIDRVRILAIAMIFPTVILMFFMIYMSFFLVFAMMAQLVAKLFMKFTITYPQACRLLVVSSTPQIVVLLLFLTCNWVFNGFGLLLIVLMASYFSFAVLSLKRESNKLVFS